MRRIAFLCLVLVAAACGGDTTTESTDAESSDTSTPTATEAPATTTTTVAETTTTVPLDPIDVLAAAAEERSITIERELLESQAEALCSLVDEIPEATTLEEYAQYTRIAPDLARPLGISQAQAAEFSALIVETACPEGVSLLAFSSSQYASAAGADFVVGDCYLSDDGVGLKIPAECSEPHNGEVLAIVEVPEGIEYPEPGAGSIFQVMESIDCATPSAEYMGGPPRSSNVQLIARSKEEFDAGERRAWCSFSVDAPILVGSVAGQANYLASFDGMVDVVVNICEHEQFAATITNNADTEVAVNVSFFQYYPTGLEFDVVIDRIQAGESIEHETSFSSPNTDTPLDCDPFVAVVPVSLGN